MITTALSHYVPILRVLEGEIEAVRRISPNTQHSITPMFEIIKPGRRSDPTERYLGKAVDQLVDAWSFRGPCYVELYDPPAIDAAWWSAAHPLTLLHTSLALRGVSAIPVIATDRFRTADYREAFVASARRLKNGVGLRLFEDDIEVPGEPIQIIRDLCAEVGCAARDVHLILDFRRILLDRISSARSLALEFLASLDGSFKVGSISVGGSSVPPNLDGIPRNEEREVPRLELRLWREIRGARRFTAEPIGLCDYGMVRPEYVDRKANFANINGKIFYTLPDTTLVARGQSRKLENLESQISRLATRILRHPSFCGEAFSWGDSYIQTCADRGYGSGSPTTWISVTTSHHLAFVATQVAQEMAVS
jgi:hypothetical protein